MNYRIAWFGLFSTLTTYCTILAAFTYAVYWLFTHTVVFLQGRGLL